MSSDQHNIDLLNPIIKEDSMSENNQFLAHSPSEENSTYTAPPSRPKQRHIYESPEAKARRLARNAERMRERRANESEEEYRLRLYKMAEASRLRRRNENEVERSIRLIREAARQRLRRVMESPDQRAIRLEKLAARARLIRQNESPEQRAARLERAAKRQRERYSNKSDQGDKQQSSMSTPSSESSAQNSEWNVMIPGTTIKTETVSVLSNLIGSQPTKLVQNPSDNTYTNLVSYPPNNQSLQSQVKYYGNVPHISSANALSIQCLPDISSMNQTNIRPTNVATSISIYPISTHYTQPFMTPNIMTPVRGRPVTIHPSNDYRSVNPAQREEAERQFLSHNMLESTINAMLSSPKQGRGRPASRCDNTSGYDERRTKQANARRNQRNNETPEARKARLEDLAQRARKRRELLMATETEEERRKRLANQAEYARQRRLKLQTPEAVKSQIQKAKVLYSKLHVE
ncbi:uncharacterized protein LOC119068359 [Bradysia coprophila]|uniref:uncharacterized protein LOC119068359 n=1 Tax=Bradysia coprophila TaxID=38358 RepID=UPI00187D7D18|nr:uncharacterized protein LOC119068359 [Bradysia coprophila]